MRGLEEIPWMSRSAKTPSKPPTGLLSRSAIKSLDGWLNAARQTTATLNEATKALRYREIVESVMRLAMLRREAAKLPLLAVLRSESPDPALEAIGYLSETPRFLWALVAANQCLRGGRDLKFDQAAALVLTCERMPAFEPSALPLLYTLLTPCVAYRPALLVHLWTRFRGKEPHHHWRWSELALRASRLATDDAVLELFKMIECGESALLSDIGMALDEGLAKRPSLLEQLATFVRSDVVYSGKTISASSRRERLLYLAGKGLIHEGKLDHGIALLQQTFPDERAKSMAVDALVEGGYIERAISVASEMSEKSEHENSLNKLAIALGRAGRLNEAFDWADHLKGISYYKSWPESDFTKQRAADAAVEAGYVNQAVALLPRFQVKGFAEGVAARIAKKNKGLKVRAVKIPIADQAEIFLSDAIARKESGAFVECVGKLQRLKARGLSSVRVLVLLARAQNYLGKQAEAEASLERATAEATAIKRTSDKHEATMWIAVGSFALGHPNRAATLVDSVFQQQSEKDEIYELMFPLIDGAFSLDCLEAVWSEFERPHHDNSWAETIVELLAEGLLARGRLDEAIHRAGKCPADWLRMSIGRALLKMLASEKRYEEGLQIMEAGLGYSCEFAKSAMANGRRDIAEATLKAATSASFTGKNPWALKSGEATREILRNYEECGLLPAWPETADLLVAGFPETSNEDYRKVGLEYAKKLLKKDAPKHDESIAEPRADANARTKPVEPFVTLRAAAIARDDAEARRRDLVKLCNLSRIAELLQHAGWFADELETAWMFCAALGSKLPELKPLAATLLRPENELWSD